MRIYLQLAQSLYEPRDRLVDLPAAVFKEVLVCSSIDPNRRDRPASGRGELFSHPKWDDVVTPAMTDQNRAADLRDLSQTLEPGLHQQRDRNERQLSPCHFDGTGEGRERNQSADLPAHGQIDRDRATQRPAGGDNALGIDLSRDDQVIVSRIGRGLASLFRSDPATHAIANIIGNEHIDTQVTETIELGQRLIQAVPVAIEVDHRRAIHGVAIGRPLAVRAGPNKATTRSPAVVWSSTNSASANARLRRVALRTCSGEDKAGLNLVENNEESEVDEDDEANDSHSLLLKPDLGECERLAAFGTEPPADNLSEDVDGITDMASF